MPTYTVDEIYVIFGLDVKTGKGSVHGVELEGRGVYSEWRGRRVYTDGKGRGVYTEEKGRGVYTEGRGEGHIRCVRDVYLIEHLGESL